MNVVVAILLSALLLSPAEAKQPRSAVAKAEFQRLTPCPSTATNRGPCHGWVIDHVTPLCAGGADAPTNMQWQIVPDAKRKDREERRMCRRAGALDVFRGNVTS